MDQDAVAAATAPGALDRLLAFVDLGGPAMWAIALLSVLTIALILWKTMRFASLGVWSGGRKTAQALDLWASDSPQAAMTHLQGRTSARAQLARAAMTAAINPALDRDAAEAETTRVARALLEQARSGLRGLELASTIGPLLGLLGTVTGMIAAFAALQDAGAQADPATLAGGIWEALLDHRRRHGRRHPGPDRPDVVRGQRRPFAPRYGRCRHPNPAWRPRPCAAVGGRMIAFGADRPRRRPNLTPMIDVVFLLLGVFHARLSFRHR